MSSGLGTSTGRNPRVSLPMRLPPDDRHTSSGSGKPLLLKKSFELDTLLDGGGSLAVDRRGAVFVAWHGRGTPSWKGSRVERSS